MLLTCLFSVPLPCCSFACFSYDFAVIEHNISILTSFESFEEEQAREEHIYMFSNAAGMPGTLEKKTHINIDVSEFKVTIFFLHGSCHAYFPGEIPKQRFISRGKSIAFVPISIFR